MHRLVTALEVEDFVAAASPRDACGWDPTSSGWATADGATCAPSCSR
ncbi:MAG: hypothetical protein R2736_07525 [Solirubrobacterales bacterium]